jgi:hypothetical protein
LPDWEKDVDGLTRYILSTAGQHESVPCLLSCPDCGLPAEITELFTLRSTDGPVEHVGLACVAGHGFRLAADRLPAESRVLVTAWRYFGSQS